MKVGIGVPASRGVTGRMILDWARVADEGPFSSLATIDRLAYDNFEPMTILSAAAGVTQRIGLMTSILLAPIRNGGVLAKQAASLDAISGGRLTLGIGVGSREDDYQVASASFRDRGKRLDEQLALGAVRGEWGRARGTTPSTIWRTRNLNRRFLSSRASTCWQVG